MSALTRCVQAALRAAPLARREDARDDVEGDEPLGTAALGVDREGDADAAEQQLRLAALLGRRSAGVRRASPGAPGSAGAPTAGRVHLVELGAFQGRSLELHEATHVPRSRVAGGGSAVPDSARWHRRAAGVGAPAGSPGTGIARDAERAAPGAPRDLASQLLARGSKGGLVPAALEDPMIGNRPHGGRGAGRLPGGRS